MRRGEEGMKLLVGPRLPRPEWGGRIIDMTMSVGSQVGMHACVKTLLLLHTPRHTCTAASWPLSLLTFGLSSLLTTFT